jgi:hypothetical protein
MSYHYSKATILLIVFATALLLSAGLIAPAQSAGVATTTDSPTALYMPFVSRQIAQLPYVGMESFKMATPTMVDKANAARAAWIRIDTISWDKIEPTRTLTTTLPTYLWDTVDDDAFVQATGRDMQVIATVKYTPVWARQVANSVCGPIAPDKFDEFAQFLDSLVKRYSVPPYNIKYWELGNEPDVAVSTTLTNYGCWGDSADLQYFGGDDYAEMLKVAYPAIKAADPEAQVLIGGLLLDCDPTVNSSCTSGKFFDGILANGGAPYFDIVSFHAYPFFHIPLNPIYTNRVHDLDHPNWIHRPGRGIIFGKADFLRERMAAYSIDKPLLLTETALVCPAEWANGCSPSPVPEFYEKQADYVISLYARSAANNLLGAVWYTLEDSKWRASGLHKVEIPTQGYYALETLGNLLSPTQYYATVNDYAGQNITGLEFRSATYRIWVLWSQPELNTIITLPAGVQQIYDKYGATVPFSGNELTVNSPVYLKLSLP